MGPAEEAALITRKASLRVEHLDAIFAGSKHVNWWRAFRAGPIKYWLRYRFSGARGEKDLWAHVHAEVADVLSDKMVAAEERAGELKKRLSVLAAQTMSTKSEVEVQDLVASRLRKLGEKNRVRPSWVDLALT